MIQLQYEVFDARTGAAVGKRYLNKKRARMRVDALDRQYGGVRYSVREVRNGHTYRGWLEIVGQSENYADPDLVQSWLNGVNPTDYR